MRGNGDTDAATVLNVDADAAGRSAVSRALHEAGFRVREAGTAAAALAAVAGTPDLVLLDLSLPDADGLEVCRRLKADAATAPIPVLVLAAACRDGRSRVACFEAGAEGCLARPAAPDELAAQIGTLVRLRRAERRSRERAEEVEKLLDVLPVGVWIAHDPGCRSMTGNRAAYELLGLPLRSNVSASAPPGERSATRYLRDGRELRPDELPMQTAAARGVEVRDAGFDVVTPGGAVRHVYGSASPLFDPAGKVRGCVGVFADLTERRQAVEALRESEERFARFMRHLPGLAWIKDVGGRYVFANDAAVRAFRGTREGLYGRTDAEVFPPETAAQFQRNDSLALTGGTGVQVVETLEHPDGVVHHSLVSKFPIPGPDGRPALVGGMAVDITERMRAEEGLRDSERRFRQLADAMPQIVWTARPDGNIDYLNRRWTEFTGTPGAVGNEGWGPLLHPDDAPTARERWDASVRTGEPFDMEIRLLDRRDQSYRWHLIRTVAARDRAGGVARWFGTATDIHEQKRAEESSRYLAEASAALADVADYEGTLRRVANLAVPFFADWAGVDVAEGGGLRRLAVAHRDPEKIRIAHELDRHYPPDLRAEGGIGAVFRTGKPEIMSELPDELLVRGAKDERHLQLLRALGLKSYICVPLTASGVTLGVLTFATAESGRRYTPADLALAADLANRAAVALENTRLYQALRDADRRKDEFLATLAHELRNPLAPIRNGLQIMALAGADSAAAERARGMMERQLSQMVRLVDDLLDVSRITRGKLRLRRTRVELAGVVRDAVEASRSLIEASAHRLTVALPPEPVWLDADPVRLAQVFGNLLNNAAKYTERGGQIRLTAERFGDQVAASVTDTGIGIAAEYLPRVFEMFSQAAPALERSQGGLGIGLALVRGLVEMHGGSVEARSDGPGTGSEFVVRLPVAAPPAPATPHAGNGAAPPPRGRKRVLVADDNQDAADSLAVLLRLWGHEVHAVHDGQEAVDAAAWFRPEVVILDIGMPRLNGYEAARHIREQARDGVMLVAVTGWGQEQDRRLAAEAGFDRHMTKPIDPAALEQLLSGPKAS
jgi:PAS domain S-box-containing protein